METPTSPEESKHGIVSDIFDDLKQSLEWRRKPKPFIKIGTEAGESSVIRPKKFYEKMISEMVILQPNMIPKEKIDEAYDARIIEILTHGQVLEVRDKYTLNDASGELDRWGYKRNDPYLSIRFDTANIGWRASLYREVLSSIKDFVRTIGGKINSQGYDKSPQDEENQCLYTASQIYVPVEGELISQPRLRVAQISLGNRSEFNVDPVRHIVSISIEPQDLSHPQVRQTLDAIGGLLYKPIKYSKK
mgnify:CR=1 FL=1